VLVPYGDIQCIHICSERGDALRQSTITPRTETCWKGRSLMHVNEGSPKPRRDSLNLHSLRFHQLCRRQRRKRRPQVPFKRQHPSGRLRVRGVRRCRARLCKQRCADERKVPRNRSLETCRHQARSAVRPARESARLEGYSRRAAQARTPPLSGGAHPAFGALGRGKDREGGRGDAPARHNAARPRTRRGCTPWSARGLPQSPARPRTWRLRSQSAETKRAIRGVRRTRGPPAFGGWAEAKGQDVSD
jgi:hypothetical protein